MKTKQVCLYYLQWLIPSTSIGLYMLVEVYGMDWFPSYIIASIVSGTLMMPLNRYIFKKWNGE